MIGCQWQPLSQIRHEHLLNTQATNHSERETSHLVGLCVTSLFIQPRITAPPCLHHVPAVARLASTFLGSQRPNNPGRPRSLEP